MILFDPNIYITYIMGSKEYDRRSIPINYTLDEMLKISRELKFYKIHVMEIHPLSKKNLGFFDTKSINNHKKTILKK